jgi:hypothetical protein
VAHAAGDEAHQSLTGPGLCEVDVLDGELLPELLQDGCADPHAPIVPPRPSGLTGDGAGANAPTPPPRVTSARSR